MWLSFFVGFGGMFGVGAEWLLCLSVCVVLDLEFMVRDLTVVVSLCLLDMLR